MKIIEYASQKLETYFQKPAAYENTLRKLAEYFLLPFWIFTYAFIIGIWIFVDIFNADENDENKGFM